MALMTLETAALGVFTFAHNPTVSKRMNKSRRFESAHTLDSSVIFDWGFKTDAAGMKGTVWRLEWPSMRRTEWQNFRNYYESAQQITWDPKDRARTTGEKYTVVFRAFESTDIPSTTVWMNNVAVELEITGVA